LSEQQLSLNYNLHFVNVGDTWAREFSFDEQGS